MAESTNRKSNKRTSASLLALTSLLAFGVAERGFAQAPTINLTPVDATGHRLDKSKVLGFAPWTRKGMPPGSYLSTPALSVSQLISQLDHNPELMKKYLHVFNATPRDIRERFKALSLVRVEHDTPYHVYYWHKDGAGYRIRMVKKGTYVFVDPDGKALLVQVCGNPLSNVLGLPELLKGAQNTSSIQEFLEDEPLPPRRTVVLDEMQMFDMGSIGLVAPKARNINVDILPKPSLGRFAAVTPITPPITPPVIPSVVPPTIPPIFPPLPPLGPSNVPEPGTLTLLFASLGSGLAYGGAAMRRRLRRK